MMFAPLVLGYIPLCTTSLAPPRCIHDCDVIHLVLCLEGEQQVVGGEVGETVVHSYIDHLGLIHSCREHSGSQWQKETCPWPH
jgi:hypothetical protein